MSKANTVLSLIIAAALILFTGCSTAPTQLATVAPCLEWTSSTVPLNGATLTTQRCLRR